MCGLLFPVVSFLGNKNQPVTHSIKELLRLVAAYMRRCRSMCVCAVVLSLYSDSDVIRADEVTKKK